MGIYLGYIKKISTKFYFKPLAELKNSEPIFLTAADRRNLMPESIYGNIWFYYSSAPDSKPAINLYYGLLLIFEFAPKDLEPHYVDPGKNTEQTGYKVNFIKFVNNKKIRPIIDENIFIAANVPDASNGTFHSLFDGEDFIAEIFIPNNDADFTTKADYNAKISALQTELSAANEKLAQYEKIENLNDEIKILELMKTKYERNCRDAEMHLNEFFKDINRRMAEIAFDGVLANKMFDAAANIAAQNLDAEDTALAKKIRAFKPAEKSRNELYNYLCDRIWNAREYETETIINIAICLTQNFLTVFYGEPGCGKTSICNLFAEALGLNKIAALIDDPRARRYVPVSVEKGWTSKRDFVGYYNPLSKTFDRNNSKIYDALRLLHAESENSHLPFVILLDEANLSPMEYYWSDFMNLCDELDENSSINLGENFIFKIPETLRFVATINSDHTTEELSPRLIDRACIITLPDFDASKTAENKKIPAEEIEIISWQSLRDAFKPPVSEVQKFPDDIYGAVVEILRLKNFAVSPRAYKAIKNYFVVAESFFGENTAFDYAVAQKILPKIHGNDDDFKIWLTDFQQLCAANKLQKSAKILQKIIVRGDANMGYYNFFG